MPIQRCYICYSTHESGTNNLSSDYRQIVMDSCSGTLFSEILGDEFDWKFVICNEVMPVCQNCWQSLEKNCHLRQEKQETENAITTIVKELVPKILYSRKNMKNTGVSSTSKRHTMPASFEHRIKIEGFSVYDNIKCKMCHKVYSIRESTNPLPLDISGRVKECCELHLFSDLFDEGFFDWNSIPFNKFVPFCEDCSQDIKNIMGLDEKLKDFEISISSNVDSTTLKVLKCRMSLKQIGQHGFLPRKGFRNVASVDSHNIIDLDEDCEIIVDSDDVIPINVDETSLQEPLRISKDTPAHSPTPTTSNSCREGYAHSSESDEIPSNSSKVSTFVNIGKMTVTIAGSTIPQSEPELKCQNCSKIFIHRNNFVEHITGCNENPGNTDNVPFGTKTCCGQSFLDEDSWNIHLASQGHQSFQTDHEQAQPSPVSPVADSALPNSRRKRTRHILKPSAITLENRCNYCDRCFHTKRGLQVHKYYHRDLDSKKCQECPSSFRLRKQLEKHYHTIHGKNSIPATE